MNRAERSARLVPPRRSAARLAAATLALALAAAGCGHGPKAPERPAAGLAAGAPDTAPAPAAPAPSRPPAALAWAAEATADVTAWFDPNGRRILGLFPARQPSGERTVFLVDQAPGAAGQGATARDWIRVLLPKRPNGATGWIKRSQVRLVPLQRRVEVDLSARRLTLYERDRVARRWPVVTGKPKTPTPTGRFYVTVKLRPPEISTAYGAWALGLSGFSDVLDQWGTGDGQIALHGTSNTASLGHAISHGCVRLDNGAISTLARLLPLGTPVTVRA
ncbi:MAG TPA: L,D-transpeptidase [Actinomycetota bacterium]